MRVKRIVCSIVFITAMFILIGCSSFGRGGKDDEVKSYLLSNYNAHMTECKIEWNSPGFLQVATTYTAYVQVKEIPGKIIKVVNCESDNYQAVKYSDIIDKKIEQYADEELLKNSVYFIMCDTKKRELTFLSFKDFCAYDWTADYLTPPQYVPVWSIIIKTWNMDEADIVEKSQQLHDQLAKEGIFCSFVLFMPDGRPEQETKEKFSEYTEGKRWDLEYINDIIGNPFEIIDAK